MSTNSNDISPKSYKCFLTDRINFLRSGTTHGDAFNIYDTQSHLYFKIFFDFHYGKTHDNPDNCHGLLWLPVDPRVNEETFPQSTKWKSHDSGELESFLTEDTAWNYLQLNGEYERAYKLRRFIQLLSDINSKSPWYFTSVSGLSEALTREQFGNNEFKIEEERKKISIKCLPDAYDNRIGTLLDLYRSIVWSHATKREIVPANLRKFDMSIYIFSDAIGKMYDVHRNHNNLPKFISLADSNYVVRDQIKQTDKNIHNIDIDANAMIDFTGNYSEGENKTQYIVGHKYIEFHNCEFNFNSSNTGYGELSNAEGFTPEYTIDISYDNAYERRYDEMFDMILGDFISWDWMMHTDPVDLGTNESYKNFRDKQGKVLIDNAEKYTIGYANGGFLNNLVKSTLDNYLNPLANKTWAKLKSLATNNMNVGYVTGALDSINKGLKTGNITDFVTAKNDIVHFLTDKSDKSSKYKQKEERSETSIINNNLERKLGQFTDLDISDNNIPKNNTTRQANFTNKTLFESVTPEAIKELGNLYKKSNASKNI